MGSEGVRCDAVWCVSGGAQVGQWWPALYNHGTYGTQSWDMESASLPEDGASTTFPPLSFCQQNGDTPQLYLGFDPAKLCSMLSPWWLSSSTSSGSDSDV